MKQSKKQNHTSKIAVFAGATALLALTPNIHAQTSVDSLLNKLEQKGILSVDEARQLKSENATNSVADINAAMNARFPMPSWITSYKFSGDFRGRYDEQVSDNPAIVERDRLRYRIRAGLAITMKDNLEAGFRVGSGDGGPLSNNQTLSTDASKKSLYVDTAYGKWTAISDDTMMAAFTIGKMAQPFDASPMVFDPDYTPEGGALQATYKLDNNNSFRLNSGAFVLDEISTSVHDPNMFGGQVFWDAKWTPAISSSLGLSAYDISNKGKLLTTYNSNKGNTITAGKFAKNYNPFVISGNVVYTLDSFPLYNGAFPIKFAGEYLDNPATSSNNEGWWAGLTLGKSGKKGTWDISYRYQRLEADAWWCQVVDDDNIAALPTSAKAAGLAGGTNIKGHLVKFNYSFTDALTFTFTLYANELINNPFPVASTQAYHAMADLMWKF